MTAPPAPGAGEPRPGLVLLASCLAQFMVVLDVSVVNVALPAIRTALGFDPAGLQWVVNAYTLTFAGFLLLGGRAADVFGRRRVFLVGLVLFGVASLVGGLADAPGLLLAARAVQGLGGAVLTPASLTVLTTTYGEGSARTRALGVWSGIGALGGAVGGLAGGVLVAVLNWRWIFLVNVPVVVLTVVIALGAVHETRAAVRPRLDVAGAVLATGGLLALVYGVVATAQRSWTAPPTWGSFLVALVLLATFLAVQRRQRDPLVPLEVFGIRSVSTANAVMFGLASAMFSMWYFVSLYMQSVLGFDALRAGLAFLPQSLAVLAGSQLSPRLLRRLGFRPVLVGGCLLTAAGLVGLALLGPTSTWTGGVLGPGVALALGMGLTFTPVATAATSGVDATRAGLVSGLLTTARQTGGALGLAVLATLATARTDALLAAGATPAAAVSAGTTRAFTVAAVVVALTAAVAATSPAVARSPEPGSAPAPTPDGPPV